MAEGAQAEITGETGVILRTKPVFTTVACGIPMDEACRVKPLWVKLVTVTACRLSSQSAGQTGVVGPEAAREFVASVFKEPWQFELECQLQKQQTRCAHAIWPKLSVTRGRHPIDLCVIFDSHQS